MEETSFFIKGDICWSSSPKSIETFENSYLLCADGKSGGVFKAIPENHAALPVKDNSGKLIIPGLTDLHTHAPQFAFRALGMDVELLEWLNCRAFPEEAKYRNLSYAREAYGRFIDEVKKGPNTRLCVYATTDVEATLLLMDMLEESGLVSFVGKVNMDRNCPEYIRENNSAALTKEWLDACARGRKEGRYKNTFAVLTPRFIPACSDELMKSLGEIQKEYGVPAQSHLSENIEELKWVKSLCPDSANYTSAYLDAGMLGKTVKSVMAHCVWLDEDEINLLYENNVFIAHCPESNINLSSGIAPLRRFLDRGINTGLGSDVAAGARTSVFGAMCAAIQSSKLRRTFVSKDEKPLLFEEAFYLGSAGGGSFFAGTDSCGAGSFDKGRDFDAVVIDDSAFNLSAGMNLRDRLERVVYLSDDRHITEKYVRGRQIL